MRISIGTDHGGIVLKQSIIDKLITMNIEYKDYGTLTTDSCDYSDFALAVAESVADGSYDKGILLCGTGIGISIAANKVKGIRAAVVTNEFSAAATAAHNDSNILCMGGRIVTPELAAKLVEIWLNTPFEGGRHSARVDKIRAIENKYMK